MTKVEDQEIKPAPAETDVERPARPPRSRLRVVRTFLVVTALLGGAAVGGTYLTQQRLAARAFVDLGTAVLTAQAVPVGTTEAGVVTTVVVAERDTVTAGQELARIRLTAVGPIPQPRTQILRAPTAGTVSAVNVAAGEIARAGEPVITLYDEGKLTFNVEVPVELLRRLRLGMAATVEGPGLGRPIAATFDRVVPKIGGDPLTATDRLTVVLVPTAADAGRVRTLVPGLRFTATVDTDTAVNGVSAVNSA
jgi:multidrug resistance efflux pump